jgi:hypothetical protein
VSGPAGKGVTVVATLAAAFAPDAGFSSGSLGTGSASGVGVALDHGACTKIKPPKPPKPLKSLEIAHLAFGGVAGAHAQGTLTLDVTHDSNGAIAGATAVFYVNYRFGSSVTIGGLAVHAGDGSVVLDSGTAQFTDADGSGNLTKVVSSVPAATAQALLDGAGSDDVELETSAGTLTAKLHAFKHRR